MRVLGVGISVLSGLVALMLAFETSRAETMVVALSKNELQISSNFTGDTISLFGKIERDRATVARQGNYDVVVVVRGPRDGIVTRRKSRVAGIWVNTRSRTFYEAPIYYAMLSSRPVEDIASAETLLSLGIGAKNGVIQQAAALHDEHTETFLNALVRLQKEEGLFYELNGDVEFLKNDFFRTTIPLPATVPVGIFQARAYLFSGGALLSQVDADFIVDKTGIEQFIFQLAHDRPLTYGLFAVALAFLTGWLGGVLFRRD